MNVRVSLEHHQQIFGLEIPQAGGELTGKLGHSEHLPKPQHFRSVIPNLMRFKKNADSWVLAKHSKLAYPRADPGNLPT